MKENKTAIADAQDLLPNSLDTERMVLATIARRRDQIALHEDTLDLGLFYSEKHKAIFNTIMELDRRGSGPSTVEALMDTASTMDNGYELTLSDFKEISDTPNIEALTDALERLATMRRKREVWTMMQKAAKDAIDPLAGIEDVLEESIRKLTDKLNEIKGGSISSFQDAIDELIAIVEDNRAGKERSLHTGYKLFDNKHLLRPGTLTVIAAFTSVGKSALAMNIAVNVARGGKATAYYSLEMGKSELAARAVSPDVGIPASIIANEALTENGYEEFKEKAPYLRNLPIYIDERSTISFDATVSSIRKMARTKGVKLVVIDYLQIYTQSNDNVEASLGQMARAAKNVAVETGTAVILLSQLNRSSDEPSLKMLRGSGQIEESADNVVLIDRPDAYPDGKTEWKTGAKDANGKPVTEDARGKAKFILAKGRGVGTDKRIVRFNSELTLFTDVVTQEDIDKERAQGQQQPTEDEQLPF